MASQGPMELWAMDQVAQWLRDIGLSAYVFSFAKNSVTGESLKELSEEDLEELGLGSRVTRLKFMEERAKLLLPAADDGDSEPETMAPTAGDPYDSEEAEEAEDMSGTEETQPTGVQESDENEHSEQAEAGRAAKLAQLVAAQEEKDQAEEARRQAAAKAEAQAQAAAEVEAKARTEAEAKAKAKAIAEAKERTEAVEKERAKEQAAAEARRQQQEEEAAEATRQRELVEHNCWLEEQQRKAAQKVQQQEKAAQQVREAEEREEEERRAWMAAKLKERLEQQKPQPAEDPPTHDAESLSPEASGNHAEASGRSKKGVKKRRTFKNLSAGDAAMADDAPTDHDAPLSPATELGPADTPPDSPELGSETKSKKKRRQFKTEGKEKEATDDKKVEPTSPEIQQSPMAEEPATKPSRPSRPAIAPLHRSAKPPPPSAVEASSASIKAAPASVTPTTAVEKLPLASPAGSGQSLLASSFGAGSGSRDSLFKRKKGPIGKVEITIVDARPMTEMGNSNYNKDTTEGALAKPKPTESETKPQPQKAQEPLTPEKAAPQDEPPRKKPPVGGVALPFGLVNPGGLPTRAAPQRPTPKKRSNSQRRAPADSDAEDCSSATSSSSDEGEDVSGVLDVSIAPSRPAPPKKQASGSNLPARPPARRESMESKKPLTADEQVKLLQQVKEGTITQEEAMAKMNTTGNGSPLGEETKKKWFSFKEFKAGAKELAGKAKLAKHDVKVKMAKQKLKDTLPAHRFTVKIKRDELKDFGFLIGDTPAPPFVDALSFPELCPGLERGDLLLEINGNKARLLLLQTPVDWEASITLGRRAARPIGAVASSAKPAKPTAPAATPNTKPAKPPPPAKATADSEQTSTAAPPRPKPRPSQEGSEVMPDVVPKPAPRPRMDSNSSAPTARPRKTRPENT